MEKKQKRAPLLPRFFLRAGLVLIGGYLVAGLVFNQVDIAAKQKELQDLENQLEQQRQQNDELERVLESGSDQEIIERVARDKLGYAKPNERVFIDVTGQ
ncbi:MAG TPA: septum formation initiator family protein [Candidatus Fournierella excrementavium]|uniref:FtsB family cell division protein n=1 Tax=Allofournierella TaxID=1940255 RepID=UPI0015AE6A9A|nr:septum formation initiator family protein [Fournierella sp.]MCI6958265.1 septum formation initiator family protein [Oscillospiraceae bacterium]MEE0755814.1 septum formation initiator family protein [Fournierella sp.]HJD16659.1 septum formation initiator family protein [Candidatus Fournierella excrementavium]